MTSIVRKLCAFTAILLTAVSVSGIDVEGNIKGKVVWGITSEPYNLIGNLQIWEGAELSVKSGVTIKGNQKQLLISGKLNAVGSESNYIIIDSLNIVCVGVQNYPFLLNFKYCYFYESKMYSPTGNAMYGSITMLNSVIDSPTRYMYIWYPVRDCNISQNIFYNQPRINIGHRNTVKVNVNYNLFYNDDARFKNLITNWAAYHTSETIIDGNSFLSGDIEHYSLYYKLNYDTSKLTVKKNYYGTIDESEIQKKIFDKNDDLRCADVINFKPFLKNHHPNIPKLPFEFRLIQKPETLINGTAFSLSVSKKLKSASNDLKSNIPFEYKWHKNGEFISNEEELDFIANNNNYATYTVVIKSPLLIEDITLEKKVGNISKIFAEKDGDDIKLNGNTKKGGTVERSTDLKNWRRLIKVSEGDFEVYVDPTEKDKEFFRVKNE